MEDVADSPPESRLDPGPNRLANAPARPLLELAFALTLGSAWGICGAPSREFLLLAATAVAAAWITWRCGSVLFARTSNSHAISQRGEELRASPVLGIGFLGLATILGALRALPEPGVPWSGELTAWEGFWHGQREDETAIRGTLAAVGAGGSSFELPRGSVRDGERIRILRGAAPAPPVRGPVQLSGDARPGLGAKETAQVIVAQADEILRLATAGEDEGWIAPLRARLERRAAELEDREAASLARAFLLGDSTALDPSTADLFTRNGLRHVLAVSGWHVAMMAWLIVRPFSALAEMLARKLPRRRRTFAWLSMLASVGLCIAYVPLTGGGAPVRRSAIAVGLASTAAFWPAVDDGKRPRGSGLFTRRIDALSLWSAALCIECWLNPTAVSEVGVQLSYAATLGLILATRPLTVCIAECLGLEFGSRPADLLLSWQRQCIAAALRRAARLATSGVAASVAAVLATAPIIWITFGEACPWGVITTPLLAPLFAALFATGMVMLALPVALVGEAFAFSSRALLATLEAVDRLPGTPALLPNRPAWLIWGTLAALWLLSRQRQRTGRIVAGIRGAAALGAAGLMLPWTPAAEDFQLHILDVGHGTCAVFRAPGEPCWIFDCGSRDRSRVAQEALAPLLRTWEVESPVVVLSHTDRDHAGGLGWVLERAPPRLWAGALTAPLAERLPHTCPRLDLSEGAIDLPEQGPDLKISLLRGSSLPGNEGSRSILISTHAGSLLLCGDAEDAGLAGILRGGSLPGSILGLLAPHHGSSAGCVGALLDRCAPAHLWVSSSARPSLASELDRRGIPWECTGIAGPITWRPP